MRIAIIIGYFDPRLGYQESMIAKYLARLGHEVFVICSDLVYPWDNVEQVLHSLGLSDRKYRLSNVEIQGYKIIRLKHVFELPRGAIILARRLRGIIENLEPNLVLVFGIAQGFSIPTVQLKRSSRYKLFAVFGDNRLQKGYATRRNIVETIWARLIRKQIYKYVFKRADRLLANTPDTIELLTDSRYGYPFAGSKMKLFPLGFDPDLFFFDPEIRRETRSKLGIEHNETVIVTAGKQTESKRIEVLIDGLFALVRKNVSARLLVVGTASESYLSYLKSHARNLDVEKRCMFLPFLERKRLAAIYNAADIGIWPVKPSITILEAMATGLFMLLPQGGSISHLLLNGVTGLYFTHMSDFDKILARACAVIGSADDAMNRAKRAHINRKCFSYKALSGEIIKEYQNI